MDHLNNTQFYEKLSDGPTEQFSEEITSLLEEMREKRVLERERERSFVFSNLGMSGHPGFTFYLKYINWGYQGDPLYCPEGPLQRRSHTLWITI